MYCKYPMVMGYHRDKQVLIRR